MNGHLHRISHITVAVFDIEGLLNLALSGNLVGGNRIGAVYRVLQLIVKCQRFSRCCLGFCGIKNRNSSRPIRHIRAGRALHLNRLLIPEIFGAGGLRRSKGICNGKLRRTGSGIVARSGKGNACLIRDLCVIGTGHGKVLAFYQSIWLLYLAKFTY